MKKYFAILMLAVVISAPIYANALSVGWDRYVVGGLRTLFSGDRVLIGATATTTDSTLEVNGLVTAGYFVATTTTATSTFNSGVNFIGDTDGISLTEIEDLLTDKTFTMANKTLTWNFTNPSGGMLWNFTGAAAGHSLEILQSGGNPGTDMHLLHIQAEDADPTALHLVAGSASSRVLKVNPFGDGVLNAGRFQITADGTLAWAGFNSSSTDVSLYRNSSSSLRTDSALTIDGNIVVSTTTATSTFLRASTSYFSLAGDYLTDITGTGLQVSGGALTLNATGDWTGTLDTYNAVDLLDSKWADAGTSLYPKGGEEVQAPIFTATSTSATSTFPYLRVSTGVNLLGAYGNTVNSLCIALTGSSALCDGSDDGGAGGTTEPIHWLHNGTYAWSSSTISAPAIVATGTATSSIKNLGGVLDASQFSGADIGAKINAAYAALPSTGGTVRVPRGNYSFSTEISFETQQKPVILECDPGGATRLTYTGSTGTSTTFNVEDSADPSTQQWGLGIRGCWFYGQDNTYTNVGIEIGGTYGAQGFVMEDTRWYTFGTGLWVGDNTYLVTIRNNLFNWNGRNVHLKYHPSNSGESIWFENNLFESYGTMAGNCVYSAGYWTSVQFINNSFDDCGLYIGPYSLVANVTGNHFENPSGDSTESYTFVWVDASTGGEATTYITGNTFFQTKNTTRPESYIYNHGSTVVADENTVLSDTYPLDNFAISTSSASYTEINNTTISANGATKMINDLYTPSLFGYDHIEVKAGGTPFHKQHQTTYIEWGWGGVTTASSSRNGAWGFQAINTSSTTASSTFQAITATAFGVVGVWYANASQFVLNSIAATFNAGATILSFLDIPSAANPTVDAEGEIAINTTAASSSLRFYDGTSERVLNTDRDKTLIISSSTIASLGGNPSATTTILLNRPSRPETYISWMCTTNTGTWSFRLGDGAASTTGSSCDTTGVENTSLSNAAFVRNEKEYLEIGPLSASTVVITLRLQVRTDAD